MQNVSLLLSELRKRTFAAIYCADKDAATITGRPPRISRKYCMRQMPLDLSDEDLSTASPDITRLSDQLDGNGWNTGARICRATWIRVKMLLSVVREDILELSLGPILDDTLTRAQWVQNVADRF